MGAVRWRFSEGLVVIIVAQCGVLSRRPETSQSLDAASQAAPAVATNGARIPGRSSENRGASLGAWCGACLPEITWFVSMRV